MPDIKDMQTNVRRLDAWKGLIAQLEEHERIFKDGSSPVILTFIAYFTTEAQKRIKAGEHLFNFADAILAETRRTAPLSERLTHSSLRAIELYWIHGEEFKKWRKAQTK
jgi:hypothetical protein